MDIYFVENHILLKISRINIKQKNSTFREKDTKQQPVAKSSKINWPERMKRREYYGKKTSSYGRISSLN